MDDLGLQTLLDWIAAHPTWAGLLVFATALAESLAFVGLLIPGAIMMFGFGALVGTGTLPLGPTLAWAVLGAVVGDGLSYWLGRHFHQDLRKVWPFTRHPDMLDKGEAYFRRHGGKSVLFGRFVGPIRPIVPIVAGMMYMRLWAFILVNVVSAILWAPAYILPGAVFGASLGLAAEVASRMVGLTVAVLALLVLGWWLVRRLYRLLQPRAASATAAVLAWSRGHAVLGAPARALLDPARPESGVLLFLATCLLGCTWLLFATLQRVVQDYPGPLDQTVFNGLQGLRDRLADQTMVAITQLGDGPVIVAVAVSVLAYLAYKRDWSAAGHWLAAVAFGHLAGQLLKTLMAAPRPLDLGYQGASLYAFPSGHATMTTVVYGFLAVLVARGLAPRLRWLPYAAALALVLLVAVSRLYLGAHWLSDVLGGMALGGAWVALLGIAYVRHRPAAVGAGLVPLCAAAILLAWGTHLALYQATEVARYTPRPQLRTTDIDLWWHADWRRRPTYRTGLHGQRTQPLTLQWAGQQAEIEARLLAHGFIRPLSLGGAAGLHWLNPEARAIDLPVHPQFLDGVADAIRLVRPSKDATRLEFVRLWTTPIRLDPDGVPLWIGYAGYLEPRDLLSLVTWLRTTGDFDTALAQLRPALDGLEVRRVQRQTVEPGPDWDGRVRLIRGPGPTTRSGPRAPGRPD